MTDLDTLLAQARQKGTDKQFREWVQRRPSCISGRFSEWLPDLGEGRCIAAHVRRARNSGTAFKPEYACVPLTKAEHDFQHDHGEAACLNRFLGLATFTRNEGTDWFDRQRVRYLKLWLAS
jgi:hypothetical protein